MLVVVLEVKCIFMYFFYLSVKYVVKFYVVLQQVTMLVQKGLLSESGNWSFQRPEYFSCVSYSTASELSHLLDFQLPEYMHVRSNAYHGSLL